MEPESRYRHDASQGAPIYGRPFGTVKADRAVGGGGRRWEALGGPVGLLAKGLADEEGGHNRDATGGEQGQERRLVGFD